MVPEKRRRRLAGTIMAHKLKILPKDELIVLAYSHEVLPKDFDAIWRALSASPDYSPDFDDLVLIGPSTDFSEVSWDLTDKEAGKFVEFFKRLNWPREKRCAFICDDKVLGAMVKMYSAYIYSRSPGNVLVFQKSAQPLGTAPLKTSVR